MAKKTNDKKEIKIPAKPIFSAEDFNKVEAKLAKINNRPVLVKKQAKLTTIKPLSYNEKLKKELDGIKNSEIKTENPMNYSYDEDKPVKKSAREGIVICKVCSSQCPSGEEYNFFYDQNNRRMGKCCGECVKTGKVNTCKLCMNIFSEELLEGHCSTCIIDAPGRYIRAYNDKAEKHHKSIITRVEKPIFNSEEAKTLFGDFDPSSYAFSPGGLHLMLFGVELEYQVKDNYGLSVIRIKNIMEEELNNNAGLRAIVKRDGTLRNREGVEDGFEIVSAPADKKYHYIQWDNFLSRLEKDDNYYCAPYAPPAPGQERGTGCGCHIHISKDSMMNHSSYGTGNNFNDGYGLACDKLQTFIYNKNNRKFIEIIAGRKSNMFSNFTQKRGIQFHKNGKIIDSGVKHLKDIAARAANRQFDHRTAINFNSSNGKTIEFRIFRSTKSKDELLKNIDFVDAICSFCRTGNASIKQMDDWIYFYEFVCKNRQDYPYLFKFFHGTKSIPGDEAFLKLLDNKNNKVEEPDEPEEIEQIPAPVNNAPRLRRAIPAAAMRTRSIYDKIARDLYPLGAIAEDLPKVKSADILINKEQEAIVDDYTAYTNKTAKFTYNPAYWASEKVLENKDAEISNVDSEKPKQNTQYSYDKITLEQALELKAKNAAINNDEISW